MKETSFEDGRQNLLATQVGWPAFKRARRLKRARIEFLRNSREHSREEDTRNSKPSPPISGGIERIKRRRRGTLRRPPNEDIKTASGISIQSCDNKHLNSPSGHPSCAPQKMSGRRAKHRNDPSVLGRLRTGRGPWSVSIRRALCGLLFLQLSDLLHEGLNQRQGYLPTQWRPGPFLSGVQGSLIVGDSAIEIQEVEHHLHHHHHHQQPHDEAVLQQQAQQSSHHQSIGGEPEAQFEHSNVLLGTAGDGSLHMPEPGPAPQFDMGEMAKRPGGDMSRLPSGPLPPLGKLTEDITDGDRKSRGNHDFELNELGANLDGHDNKGAIGEVLLGTRQAASADFETASPPDKTITGKVVDFELQPAGGHNKAKIKKKKKKSKKQSEEMYKKWGKKKKMEKKAMEKKEKKHMKKKKEEGKKGKKKWGIEVHGQKKKGNFKKKKWGKKVKKGKGVKKGKKGKKFLKDKGHKNTGFKTVYHKEEWGKSSKWHDIKREKKWDEKSKKWKKKWKKEKGKKYKGDHMKKFEKKKKEGKKYKKAKKEKFKKFKKEEFEKGKKKKMEEHKKKKESGAKKEEKKMEKKKKKKG